MKKFLILLMILIGFALSGCAEKEETSEREEDITESEIEKFTVTFDSAGGSAVSSQTVEKGEKVREPKEPTKECGCEFIGWYVGDEKWSFIGYVVTEDMTLTAKWVDCFGMNDKEREILESMIAKIKREYTWSDIESIECCLSENENLICYKVTLKNGVTRNIDVAREFVE